MAKQAETMENTGRGGAAVVQQLKSNKTLSPPADSTNPSSGGLDYANAFLQGEDTSPQPVIKAPGSYYAWEQPEPYGFDFSQHRHHSTPVTIHPGMSSFRVGTKKNTTKEAKGGSQSKGKKPKTRPKPRNRAAQERRREARKQFHCTQINGDHVLQVLQPSIFDNQIGVAAKPDDVPLRLPAMAGNTRSRYIHTVRHDGNAYKWSTQHVDKNAVTSTKVAEEYAAQEELESLKRIISDLKRSEHVGTGIAASIAQGLITVNANITAHELADQWLHASEEEKITGFSIKTDDGLAGLHEKTDGNKSQTGAAIMYNGMPVLRYNENKTSAADQPADEAQLGGTTISSTSENGITGVIQPIEIEMAPSEAMEFDDDRYHKVVAGKVIAETDSKNSSSGK